MRVQPDNRLEHDFVGADFLDQGRKLSWNEPLTPDRRHHWNAALGQLAQVSLANVPADEIERVEERCAGALNFGQHSEECVGIGDVIPGRADDNRVVSAPLA